MGAVGGARQERARATHTHHARAAMHHPAARALAESPPHHASRSTPPRVCRQGEDGPRRPRAGRWRRGGDEQAVPLAAEVGGGNCDGCGRGGALGTRARSDGSSLANHPSHLKPLPIRLTLPQYHRMARIPAGRVGRYSAKGALIPVTDCGLSAKPADDMPASQHPVGLPQLLLALIAPRLRELTLRSQQSRRELRVHATKPSVSHAIRVRVTIGVRVRQT